jgi:hypothetical protein
MKVTRIPYMTSQCSEPDETDLPSDLQGPVKALACDHESLMMHSSADRCDGPSKAKVRADGGWGRPGESRLASSPSCDSVRLFTQTLSAPWTSAFSAKWSTRSARRKSSHFSCGGHSHLLSEPERCAFAVSDGLDPVLDLLSMGQSAGRSFQLSSVDGFGQAPCKGNQRVNFLTAWAGTRMM